MKEIGRNVEEIGNVEEVIEVEDFKVDLDEIGEVIENNIGNCEKNV